MVSIIVTGVNEFSFRWNRRNRSWCKDDSSDKKGQSGQNWHEASATFFQLEAKQFRRGAREGGSEV